MKLKKITKDTLISHIVSQVPGADKILIEQFGIFCVGCPMAQVETIGQGAKTHGISKEKLADLIKKLNSLFIKA